MLKHFSMFCVLYQASVAYLSVLHPLTTVGKTLNPKSENIMLHYKFNILNVLREAEPHSLWFECTRSTWRSCQQMGHLHISTAERQYLETLIIAFLAVCVTALLFLFLVLKGRLSLQQAKFLVRRIWIWMLQCIMLCYMYSQCDSPLIILTSYCGDKELDECHLRVVVYIFLHN
jgi:hypothetical protein